MKISQIGHYFGLKWHLDEVQGTECASSASRQHTRHTGRARIAPGALGVHMVHAAHLAQAVLLARAARLTSLLNARLLLTSGALAARA